MKNTNRAHNIFINCLICVLVAVILALIVLTVRKEIQPSPFSSSTTTAPQEYPASLDLSMQASVFYYGKEVSETFDIRVNGDLHRSGNKIESFDGYIATPDSFRYTFSTQKKTYKSYTEIPSTNAYTLYSTAFAYDQSLNQPVSFYFALDTEAEYLIIHWQEGKTFPPSFLVASTDPSVPHQEILDHFQWFVSMFKDSAA